MGRDVIFGTDTLRTSVNGDFSDAWTQVRKRRFPTWSAGLSLTIPIGFRADGGEHDRLRAEADQAGQARQRKFWQGEEDAEHEVGSASAVGSVRVVKGQEHGDRVARGRLPKDPMGLSGDAFNPSPDGRAVAAVLQTRGLRKRYGSVQALGGIDLDVQRGEVFGFLGPNGAGKTVGVAESFQTLGGVFDDVQDEPKVYDVGRLLGGCGTENRVPTVRVETETCQPRYVTPMAAAVVEERRRRLEQSILQEALHRFGEIVTS